MCSNVNSLNENTNNLPAHGRVFYIFIISELLLRGRLQFLETKDIRADAETVAYMNIHMAAVWRPGFQKMAWWDHI